MRTSESESFNDHVSPLHHAARPELPDEPEIGAQVIGLARDEHELIGYMSGDGRPTSKIFEEGLRDERSDRLRAPAERASTIRTQAVAGRALCPDGDVGSCMSRGRIVDTLD